MQTLAAGDAVAWVPGVAVEFTVKENGGNGSTDGSTDMNDQLTLVVAVPLSEPPAFGVNERVAAVPNFPLKSPSNTFPAVAPRFADTCVTPASTAASSAFCICVLTSLIFEKSTAAPTVPMTG